MTLATYALDLPLAAFAPREEPRRRAVSRPRAPVAHVAPPAPEPWPSVRQIGCHAALFASGGHYAVVGDAREA